MMMIDDDNSNFFGTTGDTTKPALDFNRRFASFLKIRKMTPWTPVRRARKSRHIISSSQGLPIFPSSTTTTTTMGDCRLRVLMQRDLLASDTQRERYSTLSSASSSSSSAKIISALHSTFSADTTIRDVWIAIRPLLSQHQEEEQTQKQQEQPLLLQNDRICIWDCTSHPPKNVTDWFAKDFTETQGPKSKTLYDAGWFPSGTLQVLRRGDLPQLARALDYDDAQYNNYRNISSPTMTITPASETTMTSTLTSSVLWQGTAEPVLPSQILQSVSQRWQEDDDDDSNLHDKVQTDDQQSESVAARRLRLERERCRKLQEKILQLERKESAVSQQVRRMLIKSRATGRDNLAMQDRVYLHCIVVGNESQIILQEHETILRDDFCFFSRQDTMGKIVETLVKSLAPSTVNATDKDQFRAEFLIRRPTRLAADNLQQDDAVYRRLPSTMRLYEAMADNLIQSFDSIVVRCYHHPTEQETTSILEDEGFKRNDIARVEATTPEAVDAQLDCPDGGPKVGEETVEQEECNPLVVIDQGIANAIRAFEEKEAIKSRKKSSSTTSAKVRSMLIKSRAKGDTKRVPKMEDRFYLELVLLEETSNNNHKDFEGHQYEANSILQVFLAKSDRVERILRDCVAAAVVSYSKNVILYMAVDHITTAQFRRIEQLDMTLTEAERLGLIRPFDRMIIMQVRK